MKASQHEQNSTLEGIYISIPLRLNVKISIFILVISKKRKHIIEARVVQEIENPNQLVRFNYFEKNDFLDLKVVKNPNIWFGSQFELFQTNKIKLN